ncbi:NAD(P)-dependent oxidoreductase [Jeotgalibacillus proteolyticus]|uniref:NAD(P)-binding domain-containing protein n=1 Tax=Jeotgalibacillus proteolyticus TaxID=2082395 RepID=A0A2S5GHJ3_9BACL|nr:SDR family oxidoreductase [Jeotgalibacillus proteolyticus]PPA72428.1 hypothetical protein C4B60_03365 [Jeotgalibacillus proteolyticus]
MKIAFFGSTGRVGSVMLEHALMDGHEVQALVRDSAKLTKHKYLSVIKGDASSRSDVYNTIKGCSAVICALGTDKKDMLSRSMLHILPAMREESIKKIITIGTAGILDSKEEPGKLRFHSSEAKRRLTTAAEDHYRAFLMLKQSGVKWTIVCPTYLPDGERVGEYRIERNTLPNNPSSISIYDTGDFAYSLLQSEKFLKSRVGITY